jgi:hypothetical protein
MSLVFFIQFVRMSQQSNPRFRVLRLRAALPSPLMRSRGGALNFLSCRTSGLPGIFVSGAFLYLD